MPELGDQTILDKFRGIATKNFRPIQASLELTYRCNERCTHCYIEDFKDNPQRVLKKEEWFKVVDELRGAGTLYLILMGGEAMLNPHFWDVAKYGSEQGMFVSMITNGLKIKDLETAKKLKDHGIKQSSFSLYSLIPDIHDKMTSVRGSCEKTLRAIEYCDQVGIQVGINALLTEANALGIFDLYDWSVDKGYDMKVDPNVTPKLNGDLTPTKYRASRETLKWFYQERARRWYKSTPKPSGETMDSYACNAGKGKCAVNPYGELLPCIEIRDSLGSLVENSFEDLWYKPEMDKWRNIKVKDLKGIDSLYEKNFCEHCPGMAKNEHGDHLKATCFSKEVAQVKIEVNAALTQRKELDDAR